MDFQWQLRQNSNEYREYLDSLADWEREMKEKERQGGTGSSKSKKGVAAAKKLPPIRNVDVLQQQQEQQREGDKASRISSFDYRAWDKFDVDAACEQVDTVLPNESGNGSTEELMEERVITDEQRQQAREAKEAGNVCFKRNDFTAAIGHYSRAIELDPEQAVYHLNRSMAYLKVKRYEDAEEDCTLALDLEPKNIKALWRRSTARKHLGKLTDALQDLRLAHVLAPTDASIKNDLEGLEGAIKATMEKPQRRRIMIEEIGEPRLPVVPVVEEVFLEKNGSTEGAIDAVPVIKSPVVEVAESPTATNSLTQSEQRQAATTTEEQSSPKSPSKVFPIPTNAIEFERDWKCVKHSLLDTYHYIKDIDPSLLPTLFKSNLQSEHLSKFIHVLDQYYVKQRTPDDMMAVLQALSKTDRFSINAMFLSKQDKEVIRRLFQHLATERPSVDWTSLRKAYSV